MPLFTIESTYHLPIYRHRTYEAATLTEACRLAVNDDDWSTSKEDRDSAGENHITGAWKGRDKAYRVSPLHVPAQFAETLQRKANCFEVLLALIKDIAEPDAAALGDLRTRVVRAVAKGNAVSTGAADPEEEEGREAVTE